MKNETRKIQSNQQVTTKAKLIALDFSFLGCKLFIAIPDKPGMDAQGIIKRITATMAEMQERACELTVRDVYEMNNDKQNGICINVNSRLLNSPIKVGYVPPKESK